jgi:hypothetical protein
MYIKNVKSLISKLEATNTVERGKASEELKEIASSTAGNGN